MAHDNSPYLKIDLSDVDVFSCPKLKEERIPVSDFICENKAFEIYLKDETLAMKDDIENKSKLWLFVHMPDRKVVGYVTLIMSQISRFQHDQLKRLSRHDHIPGILISEMARDFRYRNNGLGRYMVDFVVNLGNDLAKFVGCKILIIEAIGEKISTYEKMGFMKIRDEIDLHRNPMFLKLN